MSNIIQTAMTNPDHFVIELDYRDTKGNATRRTISPIRYLASNRILALCLCRESPRQFCLSRCTNVSLINANEVLMPVPMGQVAS